MFYAQVGAVRVELEYAAVGVVHAAIVAHVEIVGFAVECGSVM